MKRFKKILVYIDESRREGALKQAMELAKRNQAAVHVIDVSKKLLDYAHMLGPSIQVEEIYKNAAASRKELLEKLVEPTREEGVEVTTDSLYGAPFLEIIREVLRDGYDLVIKSAGEEGWFKQTFFGATDMHLLRKCPCPVWIVKPKESPSFNRVLAAVDTTFGDSEHADLNRKILEMGSALAESNGAEFRVLYCWESGEPDFFGPVKWVPREEMERALGEAQRTARTAFEDAVSGFVSEPDATHFFQGAPGYGIPKFVDDHSVDLLVMGTVARTGIPGFFIGNTAERVLEQVECSVFAVKPDGFVTPVLASEDLSG